MAWALRNKSTCERFSATTRDQLMYIGRAVSDQQSRCIISFAGQINIDRLDQALRRTIKAEPILGCRFVPHSWHPYWEERDDLNRMPLLSIKEGRRLEDALWEFACKPLSPFSDPQIQACLFRADTDTLCIKLDHVAGDGEAVKQYSYLLADVYRKLVADRSYNPEPGLGSRWQCSPARRSREVLTRIKKFRNSASSWPRWGFPWHDNDPSDRTFAIRRIGPESFSVIRKYGCHYHVSVNDILLTAFYRALFKIIDPPMDVLLPVAVPVDLRAHLPKGLIARICNLSGGLRPAIRRQYGETFEDTLANVHSEMDKLKARDPEFRIPFCQRLALKIGFNYTKRVIERVAKHVARSGKSNPFLTNLGIIDKRQLDFGDVETTDAFIPGLVNYPPHFMLSASTFDNAMTLAVGFCSAARQRPLVEGFLDRFCRELPS